MKINLSIRWGRCHPSPSLVASFPLKLLSLCVQVARKNREWFYLALNNNWDEGFLPKKGFFFGGEMRYYYTGSTLSHGSSLWPKRETFSQNKEYGKSCEANQIQSLPHNLHDNDAKNPIFWIAWKQIWQSLKVITVNDNPHWRVLCT